MGMLCFLCRVICADLKQVFSNSGSLEVYDSHFHKIWNKLLWVHFVTFYRWYVHQRHYKKNCFNIADAGLLNSSILKNNNKNAFAKATMLLWLPSAKFRALLLSVMTHVQRDLYPSSPYGKCNAVGELPSKLSMSESPCIPYMALLMCYLSTNVLIYKSCNVVKLYLK